MVAKRLHGLKWPSHNKRPLEVEYVSTEEVRDIIQEGCTV